MTIPHGDVVALPDGEGLAIPNAAPGADLIVKALQSDTNGAYSLLEWAAPQGVYGCLPTFTNDQFNLIVLLKRQMSLYTSWLISPTTCQYSSRISSECIASCCASRALSTSATARRC
jgi:hypothetical protein